MGIKKAIPAILALALICFFLPFVTVSCQGQKLMTLSGIQLVTGTTIQEPQMFGPPKPMKLSAEPLAVAAFLCGLVGLAVGLIGKGRGQTVAAALAALAAVFLLILKSRVESEAIKQAGGLFQVEFGGGYWATLALFLATVGAGLFPSQTSVPLPTRKSGGGGLDGRFCTQCGAKNSSANLFCEECGAKFA